MKIKQIVVDIVLILALVGLAVFCYNEGKAYDILVSNGTFSHENKVYEPIEAINVTIDDASEPLFLVNGDMGVMTIVGKIHTVLVEELDDDDNVIKTYNAKFAQKDLEGNVINITALINELPGWSYPNKR